MSENLIYDVPKSSGEKNAIRRAKQFFSYNWIPKWECKFNEENYAYPAREGVENKEIQGYSGLPYSSVRVQNKFIGLDVSLNTFMTALDNPISVLYTRNLSDFEDEAYNCAIDNTFFVYGTVCSAFVSYSLNLPMHRSTREIGTAPEFEEVIPRNAENISLCDTLVTTREDGRTGGHIRIVTGIARDKDGNVQKIEISEGWQPFQKSEWHSVGDFTQTLLGNSDGNYKIFRYKYLDTVLEPVECTTQKNNDLMINYGDFSNYRLGETVEFNINCEAEELIIEGTDSVKIVDASEFKMQTVWGKIYKIYSVSSLAPDRYTAYCKVRGEKTASVHFIVVKTPDVKLTCTDGTLFKTVELRAVAPDGEPLTKTAKCLYTEDGVLKQEIVNIAMTDGKHLIPARVKVIEKDGKLVARTAADFKDFYGSTVDTFVIGEEVVFYSLEIPENSPVKIEFSGAQCCTPQYISWKEEASISYSQRVITEDEIKVATVISVANSHDNQFAKFEVFCENEYGKVSTLPVNIVIV